MAVYKVPQDVEAEDKLLGPLTFKQFIFLMIAAGGALFAWLMFSIQPVLALIPVPIILVFGGLAVFRREDQPVERYLLSFFNFWLRPRVRLWSTEGYYDHLVITAPKKKADPELKSNIAEVHGQLEKLAQLVDTRGWSAKQPHIVMPQDDDRLFLPDAPTPDPEAPAENEDIMDDTNPEAQQLDSILEQQASTRREQLIEQARAQAAQSNQEPTDSEQPAPKAQPKHDSQAAPQAPSPQEQSAILGLSDELTVSQIQAHVNRPSDQQLTEGEEIKLR